MTAPAARLLAAADLLDERAGEATEGPWTAQVYRATHNGTEIGQIRNSAGLLAWVPAIDAAYIATVHPEVGMAQAAMLRVLGSVDYPEVRMGVSVHTQKVFDAALALADALLLAGGS